jgi:probable rRNA maturation factor
VLGSLNQKSTVISIALVEAKEMQSINCRYRQKDYPTDVLSFGYGSEQVEGASFLGEIVIAPEVAAGQAKRYHTNPEKEMRKLLLHGILHLLGFDHERDNGQMNLIQAKLMRRRFFSQGPLLYMTR